MGSGSSTRGRSSSHGPSQQGPTTHAEQRVEASLAKPADGPDVYEGPLLVLLHSAEHLDTLGASSQSDPYATAYVSKGGRQFGPAVRWPFTLDCPNPRWNTTRDLGCHTVGRCADVDNRLHLELWEHDSIKKDKLIGGVAMPLADLAIDTWYKRQLGSTKHARHESEEKVDPSVHFMIISQAPLVKQVFLVRHGESLWNKAQREHNAKAMLEQVDHGLSKDGLRQCHNLEAKIRAVLASDPTKCSEAEDEFVNAEVVLSSPLTRAIQTALVGVSPILARVRSLRLCRNARERRNRGGRDTTGTAMGQSEISSRVRKAFASADEDEGSIAKYMEVQLDATEAADRWWNSSKESASAVRARMDEFLAQLRFLQQERIVVVGHSHFFRVLLQQHMRSDAAVHGATKDELLTKKLTNCGVLKLTLDFNYGRDRPITVAELLLETKLE